ncbi:hypothetical protein [Vitreimonas flagellata]|uniref:hypothetical protein n=1 Tax=Vitreimonas flagellata TaxID=2560861 RepID=UPI001074BAD8|nr:hypothetical protein [Vitreimonas flagellata]
MRSVLVIAIMALAACGQPSSDQPEADIASVLPEGFPPADEAQRAAECVVYSRLAGADDNAMRWEASLTIDQGYSVEEAAQLVASSVNPLSANPAAEREAAASWCAENLPDPQP